jgi:hypothetical protein
MTLLGNQRWRDGRDAYRPPDEVIRTADYDVAPVAELEAKAFVVCHHYSGTYPAARLRFGLFHRGCLVGVAVFSQPCNDAALSMVFGAAPAVELGRFVLLDEVPGNGETWFLGQIFRALKREGLAGVLSFSDPVPRRSRAGTVVFPGHLGTIYQAHNARYLGRATPRTLRLLPDGQVLSARALSKIRAGEKGWRYAVGQLVRHGVPAPACLARGAADREELRRWLPVAVVTATRAVRHPGNHRYAWALARRVEIPKGSAYPKRLEAA